MWAIFKKEWRENILYFAAAFVLVLLVLDFAAHVYRDWTFLGISSLLLEKSTPVQNIYNPQDPYYNLRSFPILSGQWTAMCLVAAVLLGLRQSYTEHLRRTWALLVQLPIRREKVIYAKFLAGLTILTALFLPAGLLIVFRLSTPGVWPGPVDPIWFLPLLLHFLAALGCYQIIFLTALAPLRWLGTRLLIPLAAVPVLWLADRYEGNNGLTYRIGMDLEIWIFSGISLLVAVISLRALRAVARSREY
jgi:ABC-type transport system involved in multi-copper enzyme maturation permease subunit